MHNDLVELGWTDDSWNRIVGAVTEEAQRARVAAQMLPLLGPEEPSTVAVPNFTLFAENPPPPPHLGVDSNPWLPITTIAVNVYLRTHELADPELKAAIAMFRRAANYVARVEDALVFNGRVSNVVSGVPPQILGLCSITTDGKKVDGIITDQGAMPPFQPGQTSLGPRAVKKFAKPVKGDQIVTDIIDLIGKLDADGHQGPYACALSQELFEAICTPAPSLVLPRDRILPFLQGPLLRCSAIPPFYGAVVALSGNPVELVVASDVGVRYLQTSTDPRGVFRISERVALRIKEESAIGILEPK